MPFPEDPIASYPMGQLVTMFVDFTDASGAAADPDVVVLLYLEGDGNPMTVLQGSLSNPSLGRWEFGVIMPLDGDKAVEPWAYRYEGTSVLQTGVNSADDKRFEVEPNPFYPPTNPPS